MNASDDWDTGWRGQAWESLVAGALTGMQLGLVVALLTWPISKFLGRRSGPAERRYERSRARWGGIPPPVRLPGDDW